MRRRISPTIASVLFLLIGLGGSSMAANPSGLPVVAVVLPLQKSATDAIRLKNGSILHGMVTQFENGFFTVVIPGTQSRAMVHINDVERIEFVGSGVSSAGEPSSNQSRPSAGEDRASPPPTDARQAQSQSARRAEEKTTSPTQTKQGAAQTPQREEAKTIQNSSARQDSTQLKSVARDGAAQPIEKNRAPSGNTVATPSEIKPAETAVPVSKPAITGEKKQPTPPAAGRETSVSIPGREVWADSGVEVKRGDRIRMSASGRVNLSQNQSTGPEGVSVSDPQRMMPNRPTGALIGVVGDDNDEFFFIGPSVELTAQRSGRLFLMVNENNVEDNSGAFTVRIRVESPQAPQ